MTVNDRTIKYNPVTTMIPINAIKSNPVTPTIPITAIYAIFSHKHNFSHFTYS